MEMRAEQSMGSRSYSKVRGRRHLYTIFCASIFLIALPPNLRPQTTSVLEGRVTDQQGLAAAGAEVHISNPASGISRSSLSGDEGAYRIPGLSAGTYTISTSKAGFTVETFRN